MLLITSSKFSENLIENTKFSRKRPDFIITGFKNETKNYNTHTQLCQYYNSPIFDIYYYQLIVNKQVDLFLKSVSCKWLLFYLRSGKIDQVLIREKLLELPEKSALFSNNQIGKTINITLNKDKYAFVCCNLKEAADTILLSYFLPLFEKSTIYPIIVNSIDFKTQVEWDKLFAPCEFSDLLSSHLMSQLQVILSRFCFDYTSRINEHTIQSQSERKIFVVKNIIDCYPFKQHTLMSLSIQANLNRQFIKLKFQAIFQKTTHQYIIEKRMEYSRLLMETHLDYSVKQVSIICGFKKPQHFIRQFKKFHQLTPGQFKKNLIK
ncbi:MAG: hypothetical protein B7Y37_14070 [Sphingobacteriia bacterium 28-36-52]|nr:MAG: hypothetical protein B7Y37_14070 [Sphingobacteriia bacterium 28-36-52]